MGRFARLAQAAYLLGRVYKHTTSPIPISDPQFYDAEALQLHATIRALIALTEVEGQVRQLEFCNQTALCYRYVDMIQSNSKNPLHPTPVLNLTENQRTTPPGPGRRYRRPRWAVHSPERWRGVHHDSTGSMSRHGGYLGDFSREDEFAESSAENKLVEPTCGLKGCRDL
jgi:hypothetical protein